MNFNSTLTPKKAGPFLFRMKSSIVLPFCALIRLIYLSKIIIIIIRRRRKFLNPCLVPSGEIYKFNIFFPLLGGRTCSESWTSITSFGAEKLLSPLEKLMNFLCMVPLISHYFSTHFIRLIPVVVIYIFTWDFSALMDCVGCEKCRLWGKLQVLGLGTALKILFSVNGQEQLGQTVSISLVNLEF